MRGGRHLPFGEEQTRAGGHAVGIVAGAAGGLFEDRIGALGKRPLRMRGRGQYGDERESAEQRHASCVIISRNVSTKSKLAELLHRRHHELQQAPDAIVTANRPIVKLRMRQRLPALARPVNGVADR